MAFFDDLKVYRREGLLAQGFWALQIYRLGHLRYRFKSKAIRIPLALLHMVLSKLSELFFGVYIGESAKIGRRLKVEHFGCIIIHGCVVMGDNCIVRQGVTIGNQNTSDPLGAPEIGDNVNIGAGAKILGRIKIGNNVDIGANAVVVKDVPDNAVVVGIPGKVIKIKVTDTDSDIAGKSSADLSSD